MKADPHVDPNRVGVVGGSAGGTHALVVALDITNTGSDWPYWNADARPQCVAALSGIYDFSDRTPPPGLTQITQEFIAGTENYAHTGDLATLKSLSPVSLVTTTNTNPLMPLYMINSWLDSPPSYHQIVDMICALRAVGVADSAYQTLTIPDSDEHSFAYWDSWDGISSPKKTVGQDELPFTGFTRNLPIFPAAGPLRRTNHCSLCPRSKTQTKVNHAYESR